MMSEGWRACMTGRVTVSANPKKRGKSSRLEEGREGKA